MAFVDVHCHLTNEMFGKDLSTVIDRAKNAGLGSIVLNGLDRTSNRAVVDLANRFDILRPALGIYPVYTLCHHSIDVPFSIEKFDVSAEIEFIRSMAVTSQLAAIGECGLDGHWVKQETFAYQEQVFRDLIRIAIEADIPVIVHSRRLEERTIEILEELRAKRVVMHCFGGKVSLAKMAAERLGFMFSIPANVTRSKQSRKLAEVLPLDHILTETDSPYLSPFAGERNEPANIVGGVGVIAEIKKQSFELVKQLIWENYKRIFKVNIAD